MTRLRWWLLIKRAKFYSISTRMQMQMSHTLEIFRNFARTYWIVISGKSGNNAYHQSFFFFFFLFRVDSLKKNVSWKNAPEKEKACLANLFGHLFVPLDTKFWKHSFTNPLSVPRVLLPLINVRPEQGPRPFNSVLAQLTGPFRLRQMKVNISDNDRRDINRPWRFDCRRCRISPRRCCSQQIKLTRVLSDRVDGGGEREGESQDS